MSNPAFPDRHSHRASAALQKLAEDDPAFAALSLWCRHRDAEIDRPATSNATTIFYGSAFTRCSLAEQMGVAAHHILHIALRHARRGSGLRTRLGDGFDEVLFNLGADALVNETLGTIGLIQPRPHVTLATLDLEETAVHTWDVERLYFALVAGQPGRAGGDRQSIMRKAAAEGFERDIEIATHGTEDEPDRGPSEMDWQHHLARALEAGRLAGRGLGALGHRLADIPETRTPWETLLRGLAAKALHDAPRPSYRRPAGRWVAAETEARRQRSPVPAFEPSRPRLVHQPRIIVALDSSGSVAAAQLSRFGAQIGAIARRGGAELHLLVFDEAVRSSAIIASKDIARTIGDLEFSRDGGTDFRPVLDAASALKPSLIVMLTDLEGPLPQEPPRTPVIWAVPEEVSPAPPFGRVIPLDR